MSEMATRSFLTASKRFAVVGASADRSKFGNKVLMRYMEKGLPVVPVHPKLEEIEGLKVQQLAELQNPAEWGLSLVTPPGATLEVMKQAHELGFRRFWLQPGAESAQIAKETAAWKDSLVILGGPCVLVSLNRGEHKPSSI